jgi:hypothetical protein
MYSYNPNNPIKFTVKDPTNVGQRGCVNPGTGQLYDVKDRQPLGYNIGKVLELKYYQYRNTIPNGKMAGAPHVYINFNELDENSREYLKEYMKLREGINTPITD